MKISDFLATARNSNGLTIEGTQAYNFIVGELSVHISVYQRKVVGFISSHGDSIAEFHAVENADGVLLFKDEQEQLQAINALEALSSTASSSATSSEVKES